MSSLKLVNIHLAVAVAFLCAPAANAQLITGSVTGTVTDASGAAIPGATVTLTNTGTNNARTAESNQAGNFRFLQLESGNYTLRTQADGFSTSVREGVIVQTARSIALPVSLEIGTITETVEVSGGAPLLEANTSELATVIDRQKLEDLPLAGRNYMNLANLIPTVRGIGYFGGPVLSTWRMAGVNIGGGGAIAQGSLMDGMANDKSGDAAGAMTYLSVDATQEFKVLTNAMSAEFGRTSGGVISVISKSGTNQFHGAAYEYLRNTVLNANEFFTNASGNDRPPVIINQFGGAAGGPVVRNKIFFHANAEWFRERRSRVQSIHSPSAMERAGDFSETLNSSGNLIGIYDPLTTIVNPDGSASRQQFPNNTIPTSRLSQSSQWFMDRYPQPNQPGQQYTRDDNLFQIGTVPVDKHTWGIKVDFVMPHDSNLAVRYTKDVIDNWEYSTFMRGSGAPLLGSGRIRIIIPRHSASAVYTIALKPTLLLDVKSGYNRDYDQGFGSATEYGGFDAPAELGLPQSLYDQIPVAKNGETGLVPRFGVGDLYNMGGGNPHGRAANTWANGMAVTYLTGNHTLKIGYEFRAYQTNPFDTRQPQFTFDRGFTQGPDPNTSTSTGGWGIASFLIGTPASGTARIWDDFATSQPYHAAYVQEDWKATQKLTLNLGLRWEYETPITDRYNRLSMFDPDIASPLQVPGMSLRGGLTYPGVDGRPRGISKKAYDHVGPRLGFAYAATSKLVVRGGYGISYVPVKGNGFQAQGFTADTAMVTSLDGGLTPFRTMADPFPEPLDKPAGSSLGALFAVGTEVRAHLFNTDPGYAQQWNFTLQYEPFNNWLIETAYIGNKGTHLLYNSGLELNQLHPSYQSMGDALNKQVANPFFGIIPTGALSGKTVPQKQLLLPYPQFTRVRGESSTNGYSQYHAFALKIEKRFTNGVSLLAAYTLSKLIDGAVGRTGSSRPGANPNRPMIDVYNQSRERSKAIEDMPHRLVVTSMWELPGDGMTGQWRHLLGGWQTNMIFTAEAGRTIAVRGPNGSSGTRANRPDIVSGVDAKLDNPTLQEWFNTDAFARPGTFDFGDSSRTIPNVMSDGLFNIDVSLFKDFPITENVLLQFRAEAFNLTNTPTFNTPNTNVASGSFGRVTSSAFLPPPREIQLALRLEF